MRVAREPPDKKIPFIVKMSIENDCSTAADMMSCAAMMNMAKTEAVENIQQLSYLVNNLRKVSHIRRS